jgi:hypothetical protein
LALNVFQIWYNHNVLALEAIAAGVDMKTIAQIMGDDPRMLLEH